MFSDEDIVEVVKYIEDGNPFIPGEPLKSKLIEMLKELRQIRQQKPTGYTICSLNCSDGEDHISPGNFNVSLVAVGPDKIQVIKALRQLILGLGLKEGKDIVDGCNGQDRPILKSGVVIEEAQKIANALAKVGALVAIDEDNREWAASAEDRFDVVLADAGHYKIMIIKIVREHTGLGLKECKDLVENVFFNQYWTTTQLYERGRFLARRMRREAAEALRKDLEEHGAKAWLVDPRGQKWARLQV